MTVGFFTVFRKDPIHYVLAEMMVRSTRHVMPGVPVVQFTDEHSPRLHDVEDVRRRPHGRLLERRLEHYAACDGEWLLLDTDVIVQRDVRAVFNLGFDVALTNRDWPHLPPTPALTAQMPFNTGVVWSRSPSFWAAVLDQWRGYSGEQQRDWMSEQRAVAEVVQQGRFNVCTLPGRLYNYPPSAASDAGIAYASVLHFKGPRKAWMRQVALRSAACA